MDRFSEHLNRLKLQGLAEIARLVLLSVALIIFRDALQPPPQVRNWLVLRDLCLALFYLGYLRLVGRPRLPSHLANPLACASTAVISASIWVGKFLEPDIKHTAYFLVLILSIGVIEIGWRSFLANAAMVLAFWTICAQGRSSFWLEFVAVLIALLLSSVSFSERLAALTEQFRAREEQMLVQQSLSQALDLSKRLRDGLDEEVKNSSLELERRLERVRQMKMEEAALQKALWHQHRIESLGRLTAGIAHEFNNLLTAIGGHLTLIKEDPALASEDREVLTDMENAVKRSAELTLRLADMTGQARNHRHVFTTNELLRELVGLLRRSLSGGVEFSLENRCPEARVSVNLSAIYQILLNLFVNAEQAMNGHGRLVLSLEQQGQEVLMAVSDTGSGLENIENVFEPFFTTKEDGTGLGLTIVHSLAREQSGTVRAEPLDQGTRFVVSLPVVEAQSSPGRANSDEKSQRQRLRILVAEDESSVRAVLCKFLRRRGHNVTEAVDGEEAWQLFQPGTFDLVITDVVMPRLDGNQLAGRIRSVDAETPILLVSGYTEERLQERPIHSDFLPKPYSLVELGSRCDQLVTACV